VKRAFIGLVLLSMSFLGCQPNYGQPKVFQVDPIFSDAQMDIMQQEADVLCAVTDGERCFELTRSSSPHDITTNSKYAWKVTAVANAHQDGGTTETDIWFQYPKSIPDEKLRLTIRHEFGHAGGCWGHITPGNVMTAWMHEQAAYWTTADIDCILG
jgi:predicted Zn-dependent protease